MTKEDSTVPERTRKEKVRDWWLSHGKLWSKRIFEYNVLALLFSFVCSFTFVYLDLVHTDATSARYMLSALVQAQAAIVAIVVSLTLIAVQLTASAYSPRVIRIFKENPDIWLLMGLYGMSIFYGLVILKKVEGEDLSKILLIGYSLEIHIIAAYLIGFFSFMMLFRYMLNIMDLLKSESIISRLANDITKDNLLNPEEKPIQPIMDIVHGSIMKYDIETTRVGLKAVTERVIVVILDYLFSWDDVPEKDRKDILKNLAKINLDEKKEKVTLTLNDGKILNLNTRKENDELKIYTIIADFNQLILPNFTMHFQRVYRHTLQQNDEGPAIAVIENLNLLGKLTVGIKLGYLFNWENVPGDDSDRLLRYLTDALNIGWAKNAEIRKSDDGKTIHLFKDDITAEIQIDENKEKATLKISDDRSHDLKVIKENGKLNIYKHMDAPKNIVSLLEVIGVTATEKWFEDATRLSVEALEEIGIAAAEKGLEDATSRAARSLENIGRTTAEKGLGDATSQAVKSLGAILTVAIEKSLRGVEGFTAVYLTNIAKAAIKNDLEEASVTAVISFRDVGIIALKKGLNYELELTVACLKDVGTAAAAKKGFDLATLMTASGLIIIGLKAAAKREFEYETEQAAESLAELTIISEENVRTSIQDYESELKEKDRDSFQKFKNLYEKKLEKLQAEQKDSE